MLEQIKKLGELINTSKKILLINHVRMDMDAFGSMSALYGILESMGKDVKAINDELPMKKFEFLGFSEIIEPDLDVKKFDPDLIISLDTASFDRLGISYEKNKEIFNKANFVVIDHHITNQGFGDVNIISLSHSSACELIYEIFTTLNYEKYITPKIATAILSGIYTDTNIFYNSNTTNNTYIVVAKLIELGADFRRPYYELYKKKTFVQSKLWGEILINHMKISKNGKLAWACVSKTVFDKVGAEDRDLEGLISEFLANIEGVEVCFVSHEINNNIIKTSLRSSPEYDVSLIAGKFLGGGHKQAAGFVSEKDIYQVEKEILEEIKKEFEF